MLNVFGKATTTASGAKYSHLFEVNETNQHQSLTIGLADETQDKQFPLAMVDSLELNATTWDFVKATASFKSQKGIDATLTPSYSEDIALLWKNVKVYLADDLAGLASATALSASSVSLTINKNLEDVDVLWSVIPQDFCNTQFGVEGTLELLWDDATYHQLYMDGAKKALRIEIEDETNGVSLTIDLASVIMTEFAKTQDNDALLRQSITIRGLYSMADSQMITATLLNTKSSY